MAAGDPERPRVSVVLPTYREEGAIGSTLDGLAAAMDEAGIAWEAIVVDDDSPDGTHAEVEARTARHGDRVRLIVRTEERGLASAVVAGFAAANGTYLAVMDADGQHPAAAVVDMVRRAETDDADVVVGSRYVHGGSVGGFGALRRFISWGAATMAKVALPPVRSGRVSDPMSGLFLVHRDSVRLKDLSPRGYKILLEVLAKARPRHAERPVVREVGYTFGARTAGESKLGTRVMLDYILHLVKLGLQDRENRRFVQFGIVGGTGVFVNLGLVALGGFLFAATSGTAFAINTVLSRLVAVGWNFTWNDIFTYRDVRRHTGFTWPIRFLRFNLVSLTSFAVYLAVALALEWFGVHYLLAALVAILVSVVINFKGNTVWTYESSRSRSERRERRRQARLAAAD